MSEDKKKEVGYAFRIGAQTDDGISIDITGNFAPDVPNDIANTELDKWVAILGRQRAKTVLANEESTLNKERNALESLRQQLRDMPPEGEVRKDADKQAYTALKNKIHATEAVIAQREQGIESLKKLI